MCYAYKQDKNKLNSRCEKAIFVGYDKNSLAYLVYYTETEKVIKNRLVKVITKGVTECQTQTNQGLREDNLHRDKVKFHKKPQNSQTKTSDENTEATTESGNSQGSRYPKRERKTPQY